MNEKDSSVLHKLAKDYLAAEGYNRLPLKAHVFIRMCYLLHICEVRSIQEIPTTHLENYTVPQCMLLPVVTLEGKIASSITNNHYYQSKLL